MRGTILGNVLLLLTIALTLVLTSASVGIFNLRFTNALDNKDHARNLAEAAIYQTIGLINANAAYGKAGETPPAVTIAGLSQNHRGVLTFNPSQASSFQCRRSTNNLDSNADVAGDGQPVPEDGVHLVGLGTCGDARCQLEMVYFRPPFAKAVSASGNCTLDAVQLSGMQPGAAFDPATYESMLSDTSLFTNDDADNAMVLTGTCDIKGSVGAVGRVSLGPNVVVRGEVRPGQAEEAIPKLDVGALVDSIAALPNLVAPTSPLNSFSFLSGGGTFAELRLDGGVLAVRGDLTVNGPISGYGAVIVDGNVEIHGGSSLGSDFASLAASGDIELEATGASSNFFQGLVYSRGNLTARRITVIGTIVANSEDPDKGMVSLQDMRFISTSSPTLGGIAPPILLDLDGDDTAVIQMNSRVRSGTTNVFDYYGTGWYSTSGGADIGEVLEDNEGSTTFLGGRPEVTTQLQAFLSQDGEDYFTDNIYAQANALLDALAGLGGMGVVSFDLNKLLTAQDQSRVLLFREVTE